MKILIVDHSGVIPAVNYGGIERVIWGLGKELVALGHQVVYLVKAGSSSDFAEVLVFDPNTDLNTQIPDDVDLVHFSFNPLQPIKKPFIVTMHGNPAEDDINAINTVFISKNHAERYGSTTFVYNGLDWNDYPEPDLQTPKTYLHFLGKVAWKIKNVFGAAKVAIRSKHQLHIIGGQKWNFRNIKRGLSFLFHPNIVFRGFTDDTLKMQIMQRSKGLIFPVIWHEPFGLALIESLYAGCAVFGTPNGSLPELIPPEVGYLSNDTKELAKAIQEFDYDPKRCHEYAVNQFNAKVMTKAYVVLYEKVLRGETLNTKPPAYVPAKNTVADFQ